MHEKEFKAKRQQPLLAVYSQSGVKSFYLDQQGSSISFFRPDAGAPARLRRSAMGSHHLPVASDTVIPASRRQAVTYTPLVSISSALFRVISVMDAPPMMRASSSLRPSRSKGVTVV